MIEAATKTKIGKLYELGFVISTFYSLGFPVVMFCFMFHPTDPVHRILVDIMDLTVTPKSPVILAVAAVYGWSCLAMCTTFITFIFTVNLTVATATLWLNAIKPVARSVENEAEFETEMMGQMDCHKMIKIYRCHQLLCIYLNEIVAKFRMAAHFAMMHVCVILSIYMIIRNFSTFIEKGVVDLLLVFGMFATFGLSLCKLECTFLGSLVESSEEFKGSFLKLSGRKRYSHKVARSFQTLQARTTYPLFHVEKGTFLEFVDVSVDHIVNLLCFE